jgi:hypothetical protein
LEDKPRVEEDLHRASRTSPELKKTSAAPPSAGDGVDLCNAAAATDVKTGMGDVVLGGDRKEER